MIHRFILSLVLPATLVGLPAEADQEAHPSKVLVDGGAGFLNDITLLRESERQVNRMIKADEATLCSALFSQLDRSRCNISLAKPRTKKRGLPKLYAETVASTVVILISRKHNDHWHVNPAATGFVISSDGIIATNFHVIRDIGEYFFAMTSDGKVHRVTEVLAGNRSNDAVLLRVNADSLRPLPLATGSPVGSTIRVVSHPKGRLYTLSEGIVSRRYARPQRPPPREPDSEQEPGPRNEETRWVTVTADFGSGSSGAPVLDRSGNVIAMATSTNGVEAGEGNRKTVQMVFRDCVPAEVILELIGDDS